MKIGQNAGRFIFGRAKIILFTSLTILFLLVITEVILRGIFSLTDIFMTSDRKFSQNLGWENKPYEKWERKLEGYGVVRYSTGEFGFRIFGDPGTKKKKIFVIGDSHTSARQVSDGQTYYDYLAKKRKDIEIFAYGCDGYGSLQEYLILDKYFDLIKPDLILWQFCGNDFINNSHRLESASFFDNNRLTRPYLVNGKIKLLYPAYSRGIGYFINKNSLLLRLVMTYLRARRGINNDSAIWPEPGQTMENQEFKKSLVITAEIFSLVKKRAGKKPVVAFGCPRFFPDICKMYNIFYIWPEPLEYDYQVAKEKGLKIDGRPFDGHLNNLGQAIVGEVILKYLLTNGFLKNENRN